MRLSLAAAVRLMQSPLNISECRLYFALPLSLATLGQANSNRPCREASCVCAAA